MQMQQGCFKKCSLLTVGMRNAIITDWAKCDEATPPVQVLCSDLAFAIAAGFVAGDCQVLKRFLCPALHMN